MRVRMATKCSTGSCCADVRSAKITESRAKEYACCFKALADPMRIRILNLLANNDDPVCVCEDREAFFDSTVIDIPSSEDPSRLPFRAVRATRNIHVLPGEPQVLV